MIIDFYIHSEKSDITESTMTLLNQNNLIMSEIGIYS